MYNYHYFATIYADSDSFKKDDVISLGFKVTDKESYSLLKKAIIKKGEILEVTYVRIESLTLLN